MKSSSTSIFKAIPIIALSLSLIISQPLLAQDGNSHSGSDSTSADSVKTNSLQPTDNSKAVEVADRQAETEAEHARQAAKTQIRLDEAKLKSCVKIEATVKTHTQNVVRKVENQLAVFDKASQKAQDFASDKNITVANKVQLIATIKTTRDKVTADLAVLKTDAAAFKCDATNPKGQLEAFKADVKLIRVDLKAYRLAVRALIQAVREANGQSRAETNSVTSETDKATTTNTSGGHQ